MGINAEKMKMLPFLIISPFRPSPSYHRHEIKSAMKRFFQKVISNALILSIGFHILLLLVLSPLYRQRVSRHQASFSDIEISEMRQRLPVRPIKRLPQVPLQLPLVSETLPRFQTVKVRPITSPASVSTTLPQEMKLQFQTEGLPFPSTTRHGYNNGSSSLVPGIEGGHINSRISAGVETEGYGDAKHHFFSTSVQKPSADVAELTLPDLALTKIGRHIIANRTTHLVDIVFVIDGSGSMKNDINAVREHLSHMTEMFKAANMDFTLGIVAFRTGTGYKLLGLDFEIVSQTRSVSQIKRILGQLRCSGDENTLDALVRAADEVRFRREADVHFILVTDEYVSGAYSHTDVIMKMKESRIRVDVIGRDEPYQKFIAKSTGGLWLPISSLSIQ